MSGGFVAETRKPIWVGVRASTISLLLVVGSCPRVENVRFNDDTKVQLVPMKMPSLTPTM